jgi:glycosyltransferase involved in cell wall biosynthesis
MERTDPAPFFTIAVPTAGSRPVLLKEALESCLWQDSRDFEILVADSGPAGEAKKLVDSLGSPLIRYTRYPHEGSGLSEKLNGLLREGRGKWMVILGDDDAFEPGYLSAMARRLWENPDAVLVRTRYRFVDDNGRFLDLAKDEPARLDPADFLNVIFLPWYRRMVNISGVLFRPRMLLGQGGFIQTARAWNADTAAWASVGALGPCCFESAPLVRLRMSTDSDYKKKKFPVETYLAAKRVFFDRVERLFEKAFRDLASASHPKLRRARGLFLKYWISEEARLYLDDLFLERLEKGGAGIREELGGMLEKIQASSLPFRCPLFGFYCFLSRLPVPARKALLWLFQAALGLRRRFFIPERWLFFMPRRTGLYNRAAAVLLSLGAAAVCYFWTHPALFFKLTRSGAALLHARIGTSHLFPLK